MTSPNYSKIMTLIVLYRHVSNCVRPALNVNDRLIRMHMFMENECNAVLLISLNLSGNAIQFMCFVISCMTACAYLKSEMFNIVRE